MSIRTEIQSLTGLRGMAALLIVWCHWGVWMRPVTSTLPPVLGSLFGTDSIAMTMFFVLSGFVIAYNYAQFDWRTNPLQSLGLFFIHRFARLYPLYLLFILYTIWLYSGVFTMAKLDYTLERELITTLLGIQSWLPFTNSNGALAIDNEFNISWRNNAVVCQYGIFLFIAIRTALPF
jgi:peptidoglycan/LPS O-acetylase OafA/YrhL